MARAAIIIFLATVLVNLIGCNSQYELDVPRNPLSLQCSPKNSFVKEQIISFSRPKGSTHKRLEDLSERSFATSNKRNASLTKTNQNNEKRSSIPKHAAAIGPCRLDGVKEMYNFAAFSAGAQVLASSSGMKGADKTLVIDSDKYMSTPCSLQSKWFVIQLSEDVEVSAISITNLEHYSSGVEYFQLLGSDKHPTPEWILMGYFRAENSMNEQIFCMDRKIPVRYLKIRLLSHYGNEQYCTLNSVKVYGSRLLEALGRALDETLHESRKTLDEIAKAGSDLKDVATAYLPLGTGKKPSEQTSSEPESRLSTSTDSVSINEHVEEMRSSKPIEKIEKPTPERTFVPAGSASTSSGPQNIITKLTNRIKDLEINQTLANHAVESLSHSVASTIEKLESAIFSMEAVLIARDNSIQSLLASAVETTNASTITILLLRRQLSSLNAAYENADSTLRMLRFALAVALITIFSGIVAALFKTSAGPIYQSSFQSPVISATPAIQKRRRRIRSGRLSKVRSMDLTEVRQTYPKGAFSIRGEVDFRPVVLSSKAADDSEIAYSSNPSLFRQSSQPFLSQNKFGALIDDDESANESD